MATRELGDDEPDAFVYTDDETSSATFLCAHCLSVTPTSSGLFSAWHHAAQHLWSTHSRRRVWVVYHNPAHTRGVQMALPFIIAHDTTRAR